MRKTIHAEANIILVHSTQHCYVVSPNADGSQNSATAHFSQVHHVNKINFVQNFGRLANLYIFGKVETIRNPKIVDYICGDVRHFEFSKWPPQNIYFALSRPLINLETSSNMLILCFKGQGIHWKHT